MLKSGLGMKSLLVEDRMANGELITEIRKLVEGKGRIPAATRDRLMLAAIADLYSKVERMYFMYRLLAGMGGIFGAISIAVLTMILTGELTIVRN